MEIGSLPASTPAAVLDRALAWKLALGGLVVVEHRRPDLGGVAARDPELLPGRRHLRRRSRARSRMDISRGPRPCRTLSGAAAADPDRARLVVRLARDRLPRDAADPVGRDLDGGARRLVGGAQARRRAAAAPSPRLRSRSRFPTSATRAGCFPKPLPIRSSSPPSAPGRSRSRSRRSGRRVRSSPSRCWLRSRACSSRCSCSPISRPPCCPAAGCVSSGSSAGASALATVVALAGGLGYYKKAPPSFHLVSLGSVGRNALVLAYAAGWIVVPAGAARARRRVRAAAHRARARIRCVRADRGNCRVRRDDAVRLQRPDLRALRLLPLPAALHRLRAARRPRLAVAACARADRGRDAPRLGDGSALRLGGRGRQHALAVPDRPAEGAGARRLAGGSRSLSSRRRRRALADLDLLAAWRRATYVDRRCSASPSVSPPPRSPPRSTCRTRAT